MRSERPCPICGGVAFAEIGVLERPMWRDHAARDLDGLVDRGPVGECRACGHVMVTRRLDAATIARIYGVAAGGFVHPIHTSHHGTRPTPPDFVLEMCQPWLLDGEGVIADFGCGGGGLLESLRLPYGFPAERLLGVDFANRVPAHIPFAQADLDALDADALEASLGGRPLGFVFSTHMLEHLQDPRRFLRAMRLLCGPETRFYLEVPDTLASEPGLGTIATWLALVHVQYFTEHTLGLLARSCGFEVLETRRKLAGAQPRLMMMLRPARPALATGVVRFGLGRVHAIQAMVARRVTTAEGPVGLWGIGSDYLALKSVDPAFARLVESRGAALFDLAHAGKTVDGCPISHPDRVADFDGTVFILPAATPIRDAILRWSAGRGFPAGRVVDPYPEAGPPG